MADDKYLVVGGFIQKFGDKPAIVERDANGQSVRDFTVKALGSQKLVRITVWPEFAGQTINDGDFVLAEGKFSQSEGQGGRMFYNLSAGKIVVLSGAVKAEREVVNQTPAADAGSDASPF